MIKEVVLVRPVHVHRRRNLKSILPQERVVVVVRAVLARPGRYEAAVIHYFILWTPSPDPIKRTNQSAIHPNINSPKNQQSEYMDPSPGRRRLLAYSRSN